MHRKIVCMLGEQWLFEFSLFARQHIFEHVRRYFCLNWLLLKIKILNILTGQERGMTELTLVWPVNMTGHVQSYFEPCIFNKLTNLVSQTRSKWVLQNGGLCYMVCLGFASTAPYPMLTYNWSGRLDLLTIFIHFAHNTHIPRNTFFHTIISLHGRCLKEKGKEIHGARELQKAHKGEGRKRQQEH